MSAFDSAASHDRQAETHRKIAQAFRDSAKAQRTEQQIRAIVRDELARTFTAPGIHPFTVVTDDVPPGGAR